MKDFVTKDWLLAGEMRCLPIKRTLSYGLLMVYALACWLSLARLKLQATMAGRSRGPGF
jgi:hypothetical protein